ncbi:MAG: transporter [Acetobacter sp.]
MTAPPSPFSTIVPTGAVKAIHKRPCGHKAGPALADLPGRDRATYAPMSVSLIQQAKRLFARTCLYGSMHWCLPATLGVPALAMAATPTWAADANSTTATQGQSVQAAKPQWYTGSLVSPSGAMTQKGMIAWEPYMTYSQPVGQFNSNGVSQPLHPRQKTVSNFTLYKYAITDAISIQLTPVIEYRWKKGNNTSSGLKFGDLPVDLMWRYVDADPKRYIPALSVFAGMAMPTGDYNRLGRAQDGVGAGTYTFRLALTEQSTYTLPGQHELRLRVWSTFRRAVTTAHLHDVTSYGTSAGFKGRAQPGMYGESGFSLEFGINQKWVLALDLARDWSNGSHLRGTTATGKKVDTVASPSGDWLIAPAIEYSWSPRFGIIAGVSTYFAGHNTGFNVSPQIAFNSVF